jgi:tetratricopeptide (TPR) repeat protein
VLWTSAVAASALFAVAARVEYRWILADWSFNKQRTYLESNSEAVIAWGERVRHNNPHRKDALKYIGRAQLSGGMLEAARDTLQQVIGYYPHSPGYHYFLALANFRLKKIEEAETHLRYAIAILPHEGRLHNLLGRIENATGNPAQALKHHRLACDLDPRNGLYHYNLGVEAYRQGLFQEAADAFQSCAMLEDDNDNAHKWLGLTLIENLNRPEAGIVHLRRALALNPRIGGAARLRGLISRFDNQD